MDVDPSVPCQCVVLDAVDEMVYSYPELSGMESPVEKCFMPKLMTPAAWDAVRQESSAFLFLTLLHGEF
jgi:hypothetical protein